MDQGLDAVAFRSDNPFELELSKNLTFLQSLKKEVTVFMSNHKTLPIKDRVLAIQKIQRDFKTIQSFIEKSKSEEINNSGIKFRLEGLKNSLISLQVLWAKMEKTL